MTTLRKGRKLLLVTSALFLLSSCNALDRLGSLGGQPPIASVQDPTHIAGATPVSMPMPPPNLSERQPNSLWKKGSRAFFRDQRATRVGDILTVVISLNEQAQLQNETKTQRTDAEADSMSNMLGFESQLSKWLPKAVSPSNLVNTSSNVSNDGKGSIDRQEQINLRVGVTITQVLPNGNLVLAGKQQLMVNNDLRELLVSGVIRPEDIASDNTVTYDQIAEARISYGGHGTMQDIQQPRYGTQLLDVVMPF
jgi:flagellar L-ring protein precursor FlgH